MSQADIDQLVRLLQSGDIETAAARCTAFLERRPGHGRALLLMSAIEHRRGERASALSRLRQAAQAFGADAKGVLDVVLAMQRIGAVDEAAELLQGIDDNDPRVASLRAQNDWRLGNYAAALDGFRMAARRWPRLADTHHALARALLRFGRLDETQRVLDAALRLFPNDDALHRLKIACLLDRQDASGALRQVREISAWNTESTLLRAALESAFADKEFDSPTHSPDARTSALASSHRWLMDQAAQPRWFGTGTGLLKWAAKNAPGEGIFVECGVFHGFSINRLAEWTGREIHGFDSFQGLPEDWKAGEPAGSYSTRGKLPMVAENVTLCAGWFEDTLPGFAARLDIPVSLLHLDCDLYSSARTVLRTLGPHLVAGSLLVFDDFLAYPGYEDHEFRAAQEFFENSAHRFSLQAVVLLGRSVAYRVV